MPVWVVVHCTVATVQALPAIMRTHNQAFGVSAEAVVEGAASD